MQQQVQETRAEGFWWRRAAKMQRSRYAADPAAEANATAYERKAQQAFDRANMLSQRLQKGSRK